MPGEHVQHVLTTLVLVAASMVVPERAPAQGSDGPSTRDGIYTPAQAARGAALAEGVCVECHLMSEEFTGTFLQSWNGATLAALYDVISTTMPQNRPGALKPREYADVLAYILSLNGVPAGATELSAQAETFDTIRIDWRP
jgi:mono/diheme cytochrome c family protein